MNPYEIIGKKEDELIPVIIPPLAIWLAKAEREKGAPLTQAECEEIRDNATAMMMPLRQAMEGQRSLGWVDVEPENVWADWHRIRCHLLGGYAPKLVMNVPFPASVSDDAIRAAVGEDFKLEIEGAKPELTAAYEIRGIPGIDGHDKIAYVAGPNYTQPEAIEQCRAMARVIEKLLELGGLGVGCESSGAYNSAERFRALAQDIAKTQMPGYEVTWPLLYAFVLWVVAADARYYSCGMHLLGFPEIAMDRREADETFKGDIQEMANLMRTFAAYLVGGCRLGGFVSGSTFSISADSPSFRATWEPCTIYEEDDLFFNPYGMWNLE